MTERELFLQALDIEGTSERDRFVREACKDNLDLYREVRALLDAHEKASSFLAQGHQRESPEFPKVAEQTIGFQSESTAGTLIAGRYKLLQQIGEGGMGAVWMADQTEPVKRRVAVKLIRTDRGTSKSILSRFEAERQAIALMDHPNIAKLLDAGTTDGGSPYFVMELVKGVPLTEFCDAHRLSVTDRLGLFLRICSAVQHAHQKGIIHRDIKPSNILVESHDGKPVPKIIDFGLAKATSGMRLSENTLFTGFGSVLGTPLYMAPEQANFNAIDVDTRADVYALGVILYELLTGTTPITRETVKQAAIDEMLKMIREQDAPTPSSRLSTSESKPSVAANRHTEPDKLGRFVKGELDWIVMKALSKERDRRYETANGFAKDIERFLSNEPVLAGPPSVRYKLSKFFRRNRSQVLAASLVLFALVAGIAGTSWGLFREMKQQQIASLAAKAERQARAEAERQRSEAESGRRQAEEQRNRAEAGEQLAARRLVEAENEKQVAQAVRDFLQNKLLNQADINQQVERLLSSGQTLELVRPNPTIRELLDRASAELKEDRIESSFPNQPLVQAELLHTVGETYASIGDTETARALLQRAVDLKTRILGEEHPQTLKSEAACCVTLFRPLAADNNQVWLEKGAIMTALHRIERLVERQGRVLPESDPDRIQSLFLLAGLNLVGGNMADGGRLMSQVSELSERHLPPTHEISLVVPLMLSLPIATSQPRREAPELLVKWHKNIKDLYQNEQYSHKRPALVRMRLIAAVMDSSVSNVVDAAEFDELLECHEQLFGPADPRTLDAIKQVALACSRAGNLVKAEELLTQMLSTARTHLPPEHGLVTNAQLELSRLYARSNRDQQASDLLESLLRTTDARVELKAFRMIVMADLAKLREKTGRFREAAEFLAASLTIENQTQVAFGGMLNFSIADKIASQVRLGELWEKAGERDKSLAALETARNQFKELVRTHSNALTDADRTQLDRLVTRLVTFYMEVGRAKECFELAQLRMKQAAELKLAERRAIKKQVADVAKHLLQNEHYAEAEILVREVIRMHKSEPTFGIAGFLAADHAVAGYLALHGAVLLKQGRLDESESILLQATSTFERWHASPFIVGGQTVGSMAGRSELMLRGKLNVVQKNSMATDALSELYSQTNRPEQAAKWKAESDRLRLLADKLKADLAKESAQSKTSGDTTKTEEQEQSEGHGGSEVPASTGGDTP